MSLEQGLTGEDWLADWYRQQNAFQEPLEAPVAPQPLLLPRINPYRRSTNSPLYEGASGLFDTLGSGFDEGFSFNAESQEVDDARQEEIDSYGLGAFDNFSRGTDLDLSISAPSSFDAKYGSEPASPTLTYSGITDVQANLAKGLLSLTPLGPIGGILGNAAISAFNSNLAQTQLNQFIHGNTQNISGVESFFANMLSPFSGLLGLLDSQEQLDAALATQDFATDGTFSIEANTNPNSNTDNKGLETNIEQFMAMSDFGLGEIGSPVGIGNDFDDFTGTDDSSSDDDGDSTGGGGDGTGDGDG